jgi:hypothetical protein
VDFLWRASGNHRRGGWLVRYANPSPALAQRDARLREAA